MSTSEAKRSTAAQAMSDFSGKTSEKGNFGKANV
jgi:hypothetical protein